MTSDRWMDMAPAYALGALDPDDREAFEAHLRENATLRALVDEYRESLGVIAESLPEATPPAGLRERILQRAGEPRPSDASEAGSGVDPVAGRIGRSDRPGTTGRGPSRAGFVAIAASVILAIGMTAWALQLRERATGLEGTVASLSAELLDIRSELDDAEVELARYDSIASAFVGTDLRFATLAAPEAEPRMHLVLNPEQNLVLVAAVNLAPAPPERVYQLWGIREGEDPVSLGTFDSGPDNLALQTLPVPEGQEFDLSAVSEEPAGGSPQPTTTPFLLGSWSPQGT